MVADEGRSQQSTSCWQGGQAPGPEAAAGAAAGQAAAGDPALPQHSESSLLSLPEARSASVYVLLHIQISHKAC